MTNSRMVSSIDIPCYVRKSYIEFTVYKLLYLLDPKYRTYPLSPCSIIKRYNNCAVMTFTQISHRYNIEINDVAKMCQSFDGCTFYKKSQNKYLIIYNDLSYLSHCRRTTWTIAHELGHICLHHFQMLPVDRITRGGIFAADPILEAEADYFAATLLFPFPVFEELPINRPDDIQFITNISSSAAALRFQQYQEWKQLNHTSVWDIKMKQLFTKFIEEHRYSLAE